MECLIVQRTDYSPATSPSLDQQSDALHKGLGRAVQWAMAGQMDEALLLEACLYDKRFDVTVNEYRGDWLWQIMQAVHREERFRAAIFEALNSLVEDDAAQLCQLGFHYAAKGDDAFRSRLYQIVEEKPFADLRWLGEEEIIRLDGKEGVLFAVRLRGRQLANRDWDWDDSVLMDASVERLGEEQVVQLLEAVDPPVKRFREAWLKTKSEADPQAHAAQMQQIPVSDIISAAESPSIEHPNFRGWGVWANEDDLQMVLERLLAAHEPRVVINYLKVFSRRAFPRIVPELISLSQHSDPEVRRWTFNALENNSHPLIRELAEHELKMGGPGGLALGLFVKNYQEGNEQQIFDLTELPDDRNQLHGLLMDIVKILEENPQADCTRLGLVAYALNPCGKCRYYAARLLRDRQVAPTWLIEESRFDSEPDTRKLFIEP